MHMCQRAPHGPICAYLPSSPSPPSHGTGGLPALPSSLSSLDVGSNMALEGDVSGLNVGNLRELRLGNNSFTGSVPASATRARWVVIQQQGQSGSCATANL